MVLQLTKPLCFFDLETTGVNIVKDRIVEISILKILPSGDRESKTWRVNPQMPIPETSTAIHGISDSDVANAPDFKSLAHKITNFIKGADLAGYNSNKFDIPLLAEEMLRADIDFDMKNCLSVDVQTIFHKMEQRTLQAAYKFYCDKTLENAHSAEADTLATFEVLEAQIGRYPELRNSVCWLSEFSTQKRRADLAGFIVFDDDDKEVFSFGKYKDQTVESVLKKDSGYFSWIQNADFPLYTKKILTAIKLKSLNTTG